MAANQPEADADQFFSKYDTLINDALQENHIPGCSIAVVQGDSIFAKGYGISSLPDDKVTSATIFNVASLAKVFTAASVSLVIDDMSTPDVQWSTPVSQLLRDDFVLADSRYTEAVTIEDILSHRSGLPYQEEATMGVNAKTPDTPKSVTRKLRYCALSAPLRSSWQYSNEMFVVAAHLVETLTHKSIGTFVRERIWNPLGMNDSYYGLDEAIKQGEASRLVKGYEWDSDNATYIETVLFPQPELVGAGEMLSTARDYARFIQSLIHQAPPISASGHAELIKPRTIVLDETPKPFWSQQLYALALTTETYHGETVIGHFGRDNGAGSQMLYLPRKKWGIVILGNSSDTASASDKICWTIIDDLLCIPAENRFDWDAAAAKRKETYTPTTIKDLYPKVPDPPLPVTLPLSSYVGTYHHAGYGDLVVEYKDERLEVDATDRSWRFKLSFIHVSGNFFVAEKQDVDTREKDMLRAEFRLDADGSSSLLGIEFVSAYEGEKIWFKRVLAGET